MQIDDIDNLRIIEDVHIPSEVTNDVDDEIVKSSTPALNDTHVHEKIISDIQGALVKVSTPTLNETHVH